MKAKQKRTSCRARTLEVNLIMGASGTGQDLGIINQIFLQSPGGEVVTALGSGGESFA